MGFIQSNHSRILFNSTMISFNVCSCRRPPEPALALPSNATHPCKVAPPPYRAAPFIPAKATRRRPRLTCVAQGVARHALTVVAPAPRPRRRPTATPPPRPHLRCGADAGGGGRACGGHQAHLVRVERVHIPRE
jgi:hypothetical protein